MEIFTEAFASLILEMDSRPFTDLLGGFYMDFAVSHKCKQWGGEFHTPQNICEMMAKLVMPSNDLPEAGPITLLEPACGSGAMVLAYAHNLKPKQLHRLRVTAIDIKKVCCDMCFINTTLWNIPAEIIYGDALACKYYAQWKNLPWMTHGCLDLFYPNVTPPTDIPSITPNSPVLTHELADIVEPQGQPPTPATIAKIKASMHQQEFNFL